MVVERDLVFFFFRTRRVPEMPRVAGRLHVDLPSMVVAAENRLDEAY